MNRLLRHLPPLAALVLAAGCATINGPQPGSLPPAPSPPAPPPPASNGAIFQEASAVSLFGDLTAHRIGDTITIRLVERTQASKSASTDAAKDSNVDTGAPILFGGDITFNGKQILSNDWSSKQEFGGKGSSSQSNSLNGSITVTVADVYPNGNLLVRGEKWLTLNQGEEYVQITGIVRQVDIAADNSVSSAKVADARITYSGKGAVADANSPGLLSRIFMKFWPL